MIEKWKNNITQANDIITKWDGGYRGSLCDLECIMIKIGLIKIVESCTIEYDRLIYAAKFLTTTDEDQQANKDNIVEVLEQSDAAKNLIKRIDIYLGIHLNMLSDEELFRYALVLKGNDHG